MEKALRKECNRQGIALLLYKLIMNVVVVLTTVAIAIVAVTGQIGDEDNLQTLIRKVTEAVASAATSGWGYLLTVVIGAGILIIWKKPGYFCRALLKKGRPMGPGSFFTVLCLFMGVQLVCQLGIFLMDFLLGRFGKDLTAYMQATSVNTGDISIWLYVGLAAPIFEEIVFRGLVLRSLEPYGRRMAIVVSALLFGLYHGNPIQTLYAFLVGMVLGYVAMEYNMIWAMVLHMFNNLIFADTLPRLLADLPRRLANGILYAVMGFFALSAMILLWVKKSRVVEEITKEKISAWQLRGVFTSPWMLALMGFCVLEMILYVCLLFMA